jgi:hypothetical protein
VSQGGARTSSCVLATPFSIQGIGLKQGSEDTRKTSLSRERRLVTSLSCLPKKSEKRCCVGASWCFAVEYRNFKTRRVRVALTGSILLVMAPVCRTGMYASLSRDIGNDDDTCSLRVRWDKCW